MTEIRFFVKGFPAPGGSKTGFAIKKGGVYTGRVAIVDAGGKRTKEWRQDVAATAVRAMRLADSVPLTGAIEVELEFRLPRPKSHYRSNGIQLKPSAPIRHVTRPDCLKLARSTEDALSGKCFRDDAQIVKETLEKAFSDQPGAWIVIREASCIEACKDILCVKDLSGGVESRHAAGEKSDEGPVPNEAVNHHRSHGPARTKDSNCADATQETCDVTDDGRTRIGLQPGAEYRSGEHGLECIPRSCSESSASPAQNPLRSESASTAGEEKQAETVSEVATRVSPAPQNLFIAKVCGIDYVCTGDSTPGGTFERVRRATPADIINIR